jgi:hypothetical protein
MSLCKAGLFSFKIHYGLPQGFRCHCEGEKRPKQSLEKCEIASISLAMTRGRVVLAARNEGEKTQLFLPPFKWGCSI